MFVDIATGELMYRAVDGSDKYANPPYNALFESASDLLSYTTLAFESLNIAP
jgi:hypothetical protein